MKNKKYSLKNSYNKKQQNLEEEKKKRLKKETVAQVNYIIYTFLDFLLYQNKYSILFDNRLAWEQCLIISSEHGDVPFF